MVDINNPIAISGVLGGYVGNYVGNAIADKIGLTSGTARAVLVNTATVSGAIISAAVTSAAGARCFPGTTLILLADGTQKPISDIRIGDAVMAFDGFGALQARRVVRLMHNSTQDWISVTFPAATGLAPLVATPGHEMLSMSGDYGKLEDLIDLNGAVSLVMADGRIATGQAQRIRYSAETAPLFEQALSAQAFHGAAALAPRPIQAWQTYNFEVEDLHTYVAGRIRVHNDSSAYAGLQSLMGDDRYTTAAYDAMVSHYGDNRMATAAAWGMTDIVAAELVDTGLTQDQIGAIGLMTREGISFNDAFAAVATAAQKEAREAQQADENGGDDDGGDDDGGDEGGGEEGGGDEGGGDSEGGDGDGGDGDGGDGDGSEGSGAEGGADGGGDGLAGSGDTGGSADAGGGSDGSGAGDAGGNGDGAGGDGGGSGGDGGGGGAGGDGGGGGGDPVILDLDGDGVEIVSLAQSTVAYDMDGDGMREVTAWLGADDAFLVIDLAANGQAGPDGHIEQQKELVLAAWTSEQDTDLEALRTAFDSNHDGVFNAQDARWSEFRLWRDLNQNGLSEAGELQTLDQAGVTGIGLTRAGTAQTLSDGSLIHGFSQWTSGASPAGLVADTRLANTGVGFITLNSGPDSQRTVFENGMVFALDRQGTTTSYSLVSGTQTLVSGTVAMQADGSAHEAASLRLENGQNLSVSADYDANGNLRNLLHAIGAVTLFSYVRQADGASLARQFNETGLLLEEFSRNADGSGHDRVFDRVGTEAWAERLAEFDANGTVIRIRTVADTGTTTVETLKTATILAADEHHLSYGGTQNATLTGNMLANTLTGGEGNDQLAGAAGNDTLNGGAGNDLLDGGTGNDSMAGGAGNDVYRMDAAGDTITELAGGGIDTVQSNISLTLMAEVENLELTGTGALSGTGNALGNQITGTASGNFLSGLDGDDQLFGLAGNDILSGGTGIDRLDGGSGIDTLIGGAGNDIYIVDATLTMGYDSEGQTVWYEQLDSAQENLNEGNDTVVTTASSYILGGNLENLTGVASSAQELWGNELDNVITGGSGSDKLNGWAGNDRLNGSAGNDFLTGGLGADTFIFAQGGTKDTVLDFNRVAGDKIELNMGTAFDSWAEVIAAASQSGYDTVINFDVQTSLTLKNISKASLIASDFVFV